jgi:hypothetical protein
MTKKRLTMSDNLVKRARHNANADMPHHASVSLIEEMADRIEELEAKLSKSEALLAKAVEAERVYCANVVKHFYDNGFFTKPDDIINRTTLAELKGQDDTAQTTG